MAGIRIRGSGTRVVLKEGVGALPESASGAV